MSAPDAATPDDPAPKSSRRGRPAGLSRDLVVQGARRIVEAEGFAALSMRRLGVEMGGGANSLYTYVRNKGELLDLVVDEIVGDIRMPRRGTPTRRLIGFGRSTRDVLVAHPGMAEIILARAATGPHAVRLAETVLSTLVELGVDTNRLLDAYRTVLLYINGFVIAGAIGSSSPRTNVRAETRAALAATPPQAIPTLLKAAGSPSSGDAQRFDYGLTVLLRGLQTGGPQ